jgi:hypothetical protein
MNTIDTSLIQYRFNLLLNIHLNVVYDYVDSADYWDTHNLLIAY